MSFITKTHLSRRTFLHGVGVTMALPLLESMIPAATALGQTVARPRTRLGAIYFPHGAIMPKWTPAQEGAGFELTEILQPIKPFYDQVSVISDLRHALAYGSGATANHNRAAAAFMDAFFRGNRDTQQRTQSGSVLQQMYLMNDAFVLNRIRVAMSPTLREAAFSSKRLWWLTYRVNLSFEL